MKFLVFLKHLFIPHDKNDYKPHFFREVSVAILLFSSIFLLGASYGSSFFIHKTVLGASVVSSVLIDLTNESRLAYNEAPLTRNLKLDEAAQMKGEDMARLGYFAHESPAGVTPWYWFKQAGYDFLYAGENLAINFTESADVQKAWLDSPLHRANLLNVKFNEIGIATVEGTYENNPTIFVVQMFGTPVYATSNSSSTEVVDIPVKEESVKNIVTEKPSSLLIEPSTSTSTLAIAQGKVEGDATGTEQTLFPIVTTNEFAIVKNVSESEVIVPVTPPVEKYSTWYGRLLFGGSHYVDLVYKTLIVIVAFSLVTMVLVEIRKQHYKHILYGVILLLVLTVLVYINSALF